MKYTATAGKWRSQDGSVPAPKGHGRSGFAESETAVPHYYGHRRRLRERMIAAGAESLPDYELLELLLFAANPRGDVKPLPRRCSRISAGLAK